MALIIEGTAELPLLLREEVRALPWAKWAQEWYCPVPADGVPYVITREEWVREGGQDVRRVYEVRYAPLKVVMHDG